MATPALAILTMLSGLSAQASEAPTDYVVPVSWDYEVAAEDIVLTVSDWDELIASAERLFPDRVGIRPVTDTRMQDQVAGTQRVELIFESEEVSESREEHYVSNCSRKMDAPEWVCHSLRLHARQQLPGHSAPSDVKGPISEETANEVAQSIDRFFLHTAIVDLPAHRIESMIRLGRIKEDGLQGARPKIQAKIHQGNYQFNVDLIPRPGLQPNLAVVGFREDGCTVNSNDCDWEGSPLRFAYEAAAAANHQALLLTNDELDYLLNLSRSLAPSPEFLTHTGPPHVRQFANGARAVSIRFDAYGDSDGRMTTVVGQCASGELGSDWQCKVKQHVKLRIPGQVRPVFVHGALTDAEVESLVDYSRSYLTDHPDLEVAASDLRFMFVFAETEAGDGRHRFSDSIEVHLTVRNCCYLYLKVDPEQFEEGRIAIHELRRGDRPVR